MTAQITHVGQWAESLQRCSSLKGLKELKDSKDAKANKLQRRNSDQNYRLPNKGWLWILLTIDLNLVRITQSSCKSCSTNQRYIATNEHKNHPKGLNMYRDASQGWLYSLSLVYRAYCKAAFSMATLAAIVSGCIQQKTISAVPIAQRARSVRQMISGQFAISSPYFPQSGCRYTHLPTGLQSVKRLMWQLRQLKLDGFFRSKPKTLSSQGQYV